MRKPRLSTRLSLRQEKPEDPWGGFPWGSLINHEEEEEEENGQESRCGNRCIPANAATTNCWGIFQQEKAPAAQQNSRSLRRLLIRAANSSGATVVDELRSILLAEAQASEPQVTRLLQQIVKSVGGGVSLKDFQHRFKQPASLQAKLERFVARHHDRNATLSREEAEAYIMRLHTTEPGVPGDPIVVDALRYTVLAPSDSYADVVRLIRSTFGESKMPLIDPKNFWHGDQLYRGINDVYSMGSSNAAGAVPEGGRFFFEVQVHTPESIALKHEIHALHKRHQASSDEAEKKQLQEAMLAEAKGVPLPKHVLDLPKKVVRPPWWK